MTFRNCWFENVTDMMVASNSMWMERDRWSVNADPSRYKGWTECPVTANVHDRNVVDAVVVQLPVSENGTNLCDYLHMTAYEARLLKPLQYIYNDLGYIDLPVIFLRQTHGLTDAEECEEFWGGVDCSNGYRKEFFAEIFNFSDGSCLAIPEGCHDVYYFPAVVNGTSCNITQSHVCQQRESTGKRYAVAAANTSGWVVPQYSLLGHATAVCLAVIALAFHSLKRRTRRRS